jgi:hypothetical protein
MTMLLILKLASWLGQRHQGRAALGPLEPSNFPVRASYRDIITPDGRVIASAADAALAEHIAQRLNETDWKRQEECCAA